MGTAGGSAQAEYERRRARDAARRRSNRWSRVAITVVTPFAVYATVRYAVPAVADGLFGWLATQYDIEAPGKMATGPLHPVGLLMAGIATVAGARELWGGRQSTEAWGKGARGEVATGRILDSLPRGFVARHDLTMPGSRANIDHVVVGPTGVFTVETKSYRDGVRITGGRVTVGGRRRDGIVEQAQRQAQAIADRTGRGVRPIVVVHGGVQLGWFSTPIVDGVRFCSPRRLRKALMTGDGALSSDEVAAVANILGPPRPSPPPVAPMRQARCSCGGRWVERRRRADGASFLGCSRFPACRQTRKLAQGSGAR